MCRALDMCPWRDSRTSGSEKLIARGLDSYWADARHSGQPSPTWIRSAQGAVPRTGQPACCPTKFLRASGNLTAWLELGCQAEDWMLATMEKDENGNAVLDQRVQVDSGFHMPVEYTATLAPGSYWSVVRGNIELRNGLEAQMKCWQKGILNPQEVLLSRRMSAEMESEKRINIYIRLPIIKKGLSVTHQLLRLQRNTEARLSILVGHNGDPLAAIPVSPAPHGQTLILHVYSPRSVASILSSSDELMAPVVIPGIDLPLITGPLVLGYMWSYCLYGILIVQVYMYSQTFTRDVTGVKVLGSILQFQERQELTKLAVWSIISKTTPLSLASLTSLPGRERHQRRNIWKDARLDPTPHCCLSLLRRSLAPPIPTVWAPAAGSAVDQEQRRTTLCAMLPKANLACTTISANAGECCGAVEIFAVARDETCLNVVLHLRQRELCGTGAPLARRRSEKSGGTHLDRLRDFRVDDSELASSSAAQGRPCYDRSRESWRWAAAGRQGRAGQTAEMRRVGALNGQTCLSTTVGSVRVASATSRKRSEAPGLQLFCVTEERERAGRSRGWQERIMYVNEFTCQHLKDMVQKTKGAGLKTKTPKTDPSRSKMHFPRPKTRMKDKRCQRQQCSFTDELGSDERTTTEAAAASSTKVSKDVSLILNLDAGSAESSSGRPRIEGAENKQAYSSRQVAARLDGSPLVPDMAPRYCNARGGAVALLAVLYLPSLRQEEYARQRTESGKRNAVGSDAVCGGLQDDGWARYCNGQRPAGSGQLAAGGGRRAAVTPGEGQSERHESPDARRQWSCIDAFVILVTAFNAVSARTIEGFLDIEEQYRSLYKDLLTRTAGALKFRLPATSAELLQSMPRSRSPVAALTYYYGSSSVFSEVDGLNNLHVKGTTELMRSTARAVPHYLLTTCSAVPRVWEMEASTVTVPGSDTAEGSNLVTNKQKDGGWSTLRARCFGDIARTIIASTQPGPPLSVKAEHRSDLRAPMEHLSR
ncbi:hypothetical protein GGX14DRAFT_633925 [Mycena pura]|uniref:Uncharacterized protein n=1 Tax=Mycena pura TaxID=153505 RepID=A0AAD6VBJ3_9AGAR|nr:hypothetical protein GGX14DRAFT_633925 [Mycena pura]